MRNDYTDYLMHRNHKYTSREWLNSKWNYYYGEKFGGNKRKAAKEAMNNANRATINYAVAQEHQNRVISNPNSTPLEKHSAQRDVSAKQKAQLQAKDEYVSAMREYTKTPLYKLESKVIKGKQVLDNILHGKKTSRSATNSTTKSRPVARQKNVTSNGTGVNLRGKAPVSYQIRKKR